MKKIVVLAAWVSAMVTATAFSLLLGLNVVLVPMWLAIGMSVGVAARAASSWSCPQCKEEMIVTGPLPAPPTSATGPGTLAPHPV